MKKVDKGPSIRQLLIVAVVAFLLMCSIWIFALWDTGATLEYHNDNQSGFVALRLAPQVGLSFQWSEQGQSVWFWTPGNNRRLWPTE
jgi:hypothetical protein